MNILRTLKPAQRLQTKSLDDDDTPILAALAEHTQRFGKSVDAISDRLNGIEQEFVKLRGSGALHGDSLAGPSPLQSFLASDQLAAMRDGANGTGRVALKGARLSLLTKAVTNAGAGQAGDNGYSVPAQRWDGLGNNAAPRLALFDLLPQLPVTSSSFEYMQLNGYVNAADYQAKEGDTKAAGSMPTALVAANIATIAHWIPCSNQVLDDSPALQQQLDGLLKNGVLAKLESQLINGVGGIGKIKGLLAYATAYDATADAMAADRIGSALTELQSAGWTPTVVVLNPRDWKAIREAKDADGNYIMGSPRDPAPPALWSMPVVPSAALAQGTALVLDASQVALLDRQDVAVSASRQTGNNFVTNMTTVLAEGRWGLAVFSPGAVLSVDLAAV